MSTPEATTDRAQIRIRMAGWMRIALVMVGVGWGANQFPPLLGYYSEALGLSTGAAEALFGFYALGLIPGLLIAAPLSDAKGRRAIVLPAAMLSLGASMVLAVGANSVALLAVGRFMAGISSGAVFGAGTAWLREASAGVDDRAIARRAAVAMTAGFGLGPLVAGLLAQWAPDPGVVAYLPHILLMTFAVVSLLGAEETVIAHRRRVRLAVRGLENPSFRRVVVPMAPWVFAAPAVAFALLPDLVEAGSATYGIALVAVVTSVTAFAGVLIQPVARQLGDVGGASRAAVVGLMIMAVGFAIATITVTTGQIWLLLPGGVAFGAAYGICLVAGLLEVGRLAPADELGAVTATYYALTYLGFAVPYLFSLAHGVIGYPILMVIGGALALLTAALLARPVSD